LYGSSKEKESQTEPERKLQLWYGERSRVPHLPWTQRPYSIFPLVPHYVIDFNQHVMLIQGELD
jgi:hypothetical protein